jgi:hypothetical protein
MAASFHGGFIEGGGERRRLSIQFYVQIYIHIYILIHIGDLGRMRGVFFIHARRLVWSGLGAWNGDLWGERRVRCRRRRSRRRRGRLPEEEHLSTVLPDIVDVRRGGGGG